MDRILRATAGNGYIKMSAVSARDTVQRAKDIHCCTPTTAAALGRTLCAASMLGNLLKEDDGSIPPMDFDFGNEGMHCLLPAKTRWADPRR